MCNGLAKSCKEQCQHPGTIKSRMFREAAFQLSLAALKLILSPRSPTFYTHCSSLAIKTTCASSRGEEKRNTCYEQTNIYIKTKSILALHKSLSNRSEATNKLLVFRSASSVSSERSGYGWSGGLAAAASSLLLSTSCSMGLSSSSCWLV